MCEIRGVATNYWLVPTMAYPVYLLAGELGVRARAVPRLDECASRTWGSAIEAL